MTRAAQDLLLDAATRLCRARYWLDNRIIDRDRGLEQAAELVADVKGLLDGVELAIGREAATREETLRAGEST